ncbi:MAG: helix-turn-helix transcriptional regulator [Bacillota bacterium]
MDVGDRIRRLRKSLKLNQIEFASRLRISKGFLSNLEKGVRKPSSQLLKLITYEFSASENWLLTGQGEMFISPEDAFKNLYKALTARHGERAVMNALHNIMKEHGLAVAAGRPVPQANTGDPELDRMVNTLYDLWATGDDRLKAWASVQFDIAIPKHVVEAQKKQKDSTQASAG